MIADIVINTLADYIDANAGTALATATIYQRDNGADLSYPAIIIEEAGEPEEHEILRGQWEVVINVVLRTIPEAEESAATHRLMNVDLNCLLGDHDRVKQALNQEMTCWDSWGGEGNTEQDDGFRSTTFSLLIKASLIY